MMFSRLALLVPFLGLALGQNNTAANNNYLGSTPSERHSVNQTQAFAILEAAAKESANINLPMNIAVVDPSALVCHTSDPWS